MNVKLVIGEYGDSKENVDFMPYNSIFFNSENNNIIVIRTPLDVSFEELISRPYNFYDEIDFMIDISEDEKEIENLKQFKNNRLEILKNAKEIKFLYGPKETAEFVKRNPILKTKKIIFPDYELDSKLVNEVGEAFKDDTSNIYFEIPGNYKLISFEEYKNTVLEIEKRINEVKKFNFSPLEKIMYVYDMVRDKIYADVLENEDESIPRSLSTALLGDKIVCTGYANIFQTLLRKLGIECRVIHLETIDGKNGHARNCAYIEDEKYGVKGFYYFDPTWDNKKNEFDTNFLYSYKYFAMTKYRMEKFDNGYLVEEAFPYFSGDMDIEFELQVEDVGFTGLSKEMIISINYMSNLMYGHSLIPEIFLTNREIFIPSILNPDKNEISEKLHELIEYFDAPISADILLKVLYNVRKYQYYLNPQKYPFELKDFYKTATVSKWNFIKTLDDFELMFNHTKDEITRMKSNQIAKYLEEDEVDKNIQKVKLAKTLRQVYEQKNKGRR